jgi:eukaryotic-like serine/threonine-protein kinase
MSGEKPLRRPDPERRYSAGEDVPERPDPSAKTQFVLKADGGKSTETSTMPGLPSYAGTTHYTLVREIATGGAGVVHEARQAGVEGFSKRVAIKTLRPQFLESERLRSMFVREAKLAARLVHENIVQIHQLGAHDGQLFIVMEFVDGVSLAELLRRHRRARSELPISLAVFIASRIARGLAYAHERRDSTGRPLGIVHRDVSPQNILLSQEGLPKLADFGLAVLAHDHAASIDPAGKLAYMPPEQAKGESLDHRADIFALGAVLFELLAGRPLREADSFQELLVQCRDGLVFWDRLSSVVPDELEDLLAGCLQADRDRRSSDTSVVARRLEEYIYRDGYGPTINTLKEHLRELVPELYTFDTTPRGAEDHSGMDATRLEDF